MTGNFLKNFQEKISWALACGVFVWCFVFLFYRTFFGVDFFDEPYYSALCLRLFSGQKLFVDELYLAQTFSVLSYPFFKLHWLLNSSLDGVILFQRHAMVFLSLLMALLVFLSFRKNLGGPAALLISTSVSLFFPGNMLTLSYNTLGTFFLTTGLLLLYLGLLKGNRVLFLLAGISIALCSIAYVTFCIFTVFLVAYLFLFCKEKKAALFFTIGNGLAFAYPFYFIGNHFSEFLIALSFGKEFLHETPTLPQVFGVLHKFIPKTVILFSTLWVGLFYFLKTKSRTTLNILNALIPLAAFALATFSWGDWNLFPFYFSCLCLLPFSVTPSTTEKKTALLGLFIPSMAAGMIASLTSASGYINSQVGLLPAVIAGLGFIFQSISSSSRFSASLRMTTLALFPFLVLFFPLNIWSDAPFKELITKVEMGPYEGIYSTPQKKRVIETVYMELKPLLETGGPLLVYPNFPSIYLISPVPPAKGVTWYQNSGRTNEILAKLYKKQINPQSRVVRMKIGHGAPIEKPTQRFDSKDPLNELIETTHVPVKDTPWYTLFAPK